MRQHDQPQGEAANSTGHIDQQHRELANERENNLVAMSKTQTALIESLQTTIRELQAEMSRMRQSGNDGNQSGSGF